VIVRNSLPPGVALGGLDAERMLPQGGGCGAKTHRRPSGADMVRERSSVGRAQPGGDPVGMIDAYEPIGTLTFAF
jgi:hypothetical protein